MLYKWFVILIFAFLYTFRLLEVPTGLTVDEAAFGYNAALLSETGRDENSRSWPVFVLSIEGKDWRQPVTEYFVVFLYKLFGPSVFLLRFSSVLIAVISLWLIYKLAETVLGKKSGLWAVLVLGSSPLFFIHARLGLDNIMPVPFTILWLWTISKFLKTGTKNWLLLSGLALGVAFYTYKGMRAIVPLWSFLSIIMIVKKVGWQKWFGVEVLYFVVSILPFVLMIPILDHFYAGAVMGGSRPAGNSIYELASAYLSSYDWSYLFVRGDITLYHSTGLHGVLLLATLPLLVIGLVSILKKLDNPKILILYSLIIAPLFYGFVGSQHRFSRLLALLPMLVLLIVNGIVWIRDYKGKAYKYLVTILLLLSFLNFGDFLKYYFVTYPGVTQSLVGEMKGYKDFEVLKKVAEQKKLDPVISNTIGDKTNQSHNFYQAVYFGKLLPTRNDDLGAVEGEILLTQREKIVGNKAENYPLDKYFLQVKE